MSKLFLKGPRPLAALLGLVGASVGALLIFTTGATARSGEFPTPRRAPSISGTPQEGQTLTGNGGQWLYNSTGLLCDECSHAFRWQRGNAEAFDFVDIPGATSMTYTLGAADVGRRVRFVHTISKYDCNATGSECRNVSDSQVSAPTDVIRPKAVPAPTLGELPKITGMPMEQEVLTASTGVWNGQQPISVQFQWYRCDARGDGPVAIPGANAQTYRLTTADVGGTIRVTATATNSGGSNFATSEQTAVIQPLGPSAGRRSITVDLVSLPNRLVIDRFASTPTVLRSLARFTFRVHVSDTRGFWIQRALVQVVSVPFGQVVAVPEARTDARGWATFRLRPTAKLQLRRGASLFLLLRARKPGENPRAGVTTQRLAQIRLTAP